MAVPLALKEDDELRAVIITGAGRGFCAGFDLDQVHEITEMGVRAFLKFQELATGSLAAIRGLRVPVIAAVNGAASGGGMSLALAADIRLASPTARFNAAFVKIGLSVGELGTSWTLTRLIGPGRAAEIAYTARMVEAEEAERIGLVNRVVPAAALLIEAKKLAAELARQAPIAVRYIIDAINHGLEMPFVDGCRFEATLFGLVAATEDMREGTRSFLEKRKPEFTGR
jgi:enoyl-CoA hydratase/carnithine racemase